VTDVTNLQSTALNGQQQCAKSASSNNDIAPLKQRFRAFPVLIPRVSTLSLVRPTARTALRVAYCWSERGLGGLWSDRDEEERPKMRGNPSGAFCDSGTVSVSYLESSEDPTHVSYENRRPKQ
jgi:hypothetical protein